jgi:hypothetical protein
MKKKSIIRFALGVCTIALMTISTPLSAQPSIPDVTGVKNVELGLACKVTLIQADKASITITGDKDALEDVHARLRGDRLEIYNDKHHQHKDEVSITIALPDLEEISFTGVVDIITPNQVSYDDLKLKVSGVADLDIKLKSKILSINASGVLSGEITGETKDLKVEISGVGTLDASGFKSENCDIEVSGVAKASVYATEKLDASVSGMGKITYQGHPIINKSSSGFGSINSL